METRFKIGDILAIKVKDENGKNTGLKLLGQVMSVRKTETYNSKGVETNIDYFDSKNVYMLCDREVNGVKTLNFDVVCLVPKDSEEV